MPSDPTRLNVLSAGAVKYVLTGLAPDFSAARGLPVEFSFGTIAGVRQQLRDGARPDVIIGTMPAIVAMEQEGTVLAGSTSEIGRTLTGLCVRDGTAIPDISTAERFKQAMLDTRSIAYTNPAAGGTSGIYLVSLLEQLGIADVVRQKAHLCINGDDVVDRVMAGDAELGSTFISEFITRQGIAVVGPLPGAIAHGMNYAAGLAAAGGHREAARAFIEHLTRPTQRNYLASRGFTPPS
jgi:molybdate transport system substrate-binding protein